MPKQKISIKELARLTNRQAKALLGRDFTTEERTAIDKARALTSVMNARREPMSAADRQAARIARRTDIGEIPPCRNPARRAAAEKSVVDFGVSYCLAAPDSAGLLNRPPSPVIAQYARDLQSVIEGSGALHIRFPRGAGKTSWVKIAILWGLVTGRIRYAVVFAASAAQAQSILNDIWLVIEGSRTFLEDWPMVAYPVRCAEGLTQRFAGQRYTFVNEAGEKVSERTAIQRTSKSITLPTIHGSAASGAVVMALGAGCATRGLVRGAQRVDLVLLDDVQTRATASSPVQCQKLSEWISGDVRGLAGASLLRMAMTSTPIRSGDLSEQFADPALHPEWRTVSYPLVISWPARDDLWEEYDALYREDIRRGDTSFRTACAFYAEHRKEMDEGGEVIDPSAYDTALELSGIQHARNLLITMGRSAFSAELQLSVINDEATIAVTPKLVASKVNGTPRYVLPRGTMKLCAFVDVNVVAGLSYVVTAFGPHQVAAVVDAGRYPGRNRRIVKENATERETEEAVAQAVYALVAKLRATTFTDEKGRKQKIGAIWIDNGYLGKTIEGVAELVRKRGFQNCYACKGYSNEYHNTNSKTVVAKGEGVDCRVLDGATWMTQNSDLSKESAQSAFLGVPLQPGTISLWGNDPLDHWELAEEICSETLTDKATSKRGVTMYRWSLRPGKSNHWLDALSGTLSMGRWYRFWDSGEVVESSNPPPPGAGYPKPRRTHRKARIRSARPVEV